MRNELSLQLKCLHRTVQRSRLFLTRGEIELCESSCSRQGPAHAPRPPWSECKVEASWKRHGQRHEHVMGGGV